MNGWLHPRAHLSLTLALVAAWFTMVTVAETSATPSMHCHRVPMPCCPPSDAGAAHCSAAECCAQLPQKTETGVRTPVAQASGAALAVATLRFPALTRALTSGVTWKPEVFRLKDDSRI